MHINLCVFNNISPATNDVKGIADHIIVLRNLLENLGIDYRVSELLDPNGLNILIENFFDSGVRYIHEFCRRYNKMICVVMTEHFRLSEGELYFGNYKASDTEYIGNIGNRIYSILALSESVLAFMTLGELPKLESNTDIFFKNNIYRVGYPRIENTYEHSDSKLFDLSFTGYKTKYRDKVISDLSKAYKVAYYDIVSDENERKRNVSTAKVCLNIPQNDEWHWISPMRIIYSLSLGVPCVHMGEGDDTQFYNDVLSWTSIDEALSDPFGTLQRQISACNNLSLENEKIRSLFEVWNLMEAR